MITASQLHIDRWLKQGALYAAWGTGATAVGLFLFFLTYPWNAAGLAMQGGGSMQKGGRTFFPYEAIGSGAMALHPRHAFGWVSRLADELALIAYNSRPDTDPQEAKILLSLKNGKEQLTLSNGHTLFLKESDQGKGLHASDAATGLWVKPLLLDNGAVLVEAGRTLVSKEGLTGEEKGQFIIAQQGGGPARYNPTQQPYVKEIKSARSFPQDLLIQKYGGREYASWKDKAVLLLTGGSKTYACFVSAGDYLLYDSGEWRVAAYEDLQRDHPVAHVRAANGHALDLEVWDETGFYPLQFKIEMERQAHLQLKPEAMPSGIRLRNATQVSCALGKRRVILRQGDWLLKTSSGWRNLRRAEEIEQYLSHRLRGELIIFDGIEKEQGRSVIKGHMFDETRTQVQPLVLPIDAEKAQGKISRKRKPILPGAQRRAA